MSASAVWCELALVGGDVRADVAIAVEDGRFRTIEVGAPAPRGATRLPGLTVAGFANAHSHAFHRALRSRTQADAGSFWTWRDVMYRAASRLDPDRYRRLARATFAEMACAGIAAVGEFHYVHHQPDGSPYCEPNAIGEALLAAASEAGIRITLLDTLYLHGGLSAGGYTPVAGPQRRYRDAGVEAWIARVEQLRPAPSQRIGAAIHSVRAVDPAAMRVAADWATRRSAPLHVHVSEQPAENEQCAAHHGTTPVGLLGASGVLGDRCTAVHATHLTRRDVTRLATSSTTVCLCPTTERDLGDGIGATGELAAAGVPIALGSDSHAVIDLLEEARAVELDARSRSRRRGTQTASQLLAMATVNGHRSLGWDDAGTIAAGERADLVTIALDSVRTAGAGAPAAIEAAVFAASASDVTHVVVDGHLIVEHGRHTRIDVAGELQASITELLDP